MITYEWLYWLAGAFFAFWSILSLRDKRIGNGVFWRSVSSPVATCPI